MIINKLQTLASNKPVQMIVSAGRHNCKQFQLKITMLLSFGHLNTIQVKQRLPDKYEKSYRLKTMPYF